MGCGLLIKATFSVVMALTSSSSLVLNCAGGAGIASRGMSSRLEALFLEVRTRMVAVEDILEDGRLVRSISGLGT